MLKKASLLLIAVGLGVSMLSCSTSVHIDTGVVISDNDLIGDVSDGGAFVGAAINSYGEWVAAGSKGIAFGNGNRNDFNIIPMSTGATSADRAIDLNDNGNFVAAFSDGIYFGDVTGSLVKVMSGNLGNFIVARINNNDIWLVSSEDGLYISSGTNAPVFLDYLNNLGEFSHCSLNSYDEFVAAGSLQVLYGYVDTDGTVQLFSYDPVSVFNDAVSTDINEYGEFVATGSLQTLIGVADGTKSAVLRTVRKSTKTFAAPSGTDVPIVARTEAKTAKWTVNRHYKAWFSSHDSRKQVTKAAPIYHSCGINNYQDYVAAGDDYLVYNDSNYNPVTAPGEMVAADIDDLGDWVVAGTDGVYFNGNYLYDGMRNGDYVSLKEDENSNFIFATSYSVYHYNASTGNLIDDGPVADSGYPVAADMANSRWVTVGNYGVLLWNY